ncbi:hypothetical protein EH240_05780 [Mesorhizobium tamadayense]|uniref:Uncharacterized protein n=1 Tax=Mesorhizobium tamadayense TaxID=425306 RepID=A0A3P3G3G3_9HYPH|nr:hypothetical protein EH240_05780 [Mesorhizobium tamadayense]
MKYQDTPWGKLDHRTGLELDALGSYPGVASLVGFVPWRLPDAGPSARRLSQKAGIRNPSQKLTPDIEKLLFAIVRTLQKLDICGGVRGILAARPVRRVEVARSIGKPFSRLHPNRKLIAARIFLSAG